ncbi:restriction endonuclease subunit S [Terrisporobacter muris]|uniref:Restriction endonuclease subunit S n=1 Tax=Terrisporobacter muris TaxID=2963284 RepID=A0A9X2MAQ3_9FIRM|nr:restriction endonuclease subunit S [Terrisporobacter muris]MCR1822357.1 restriction endonuclease subunit S [Terrisporobacter muris]SCH73592.1 EcoKI restriction-modification system protein HsdS [uncultured Clostridium sp.]
MRVNAEFKEVKGIGRIPVDWEVKTTAEIFHTVTDYVANGSFATLNENVTYKDTEDYAILVRLTDYKNDFKGPFVYVDKHSYDFLKKSSLKKDDVIISNVGAYAGFTFKLRDLNKPMTLGPNAILVRSNINNDYIYYWFTSNLGQYALKNIISTTAQPKFNKTDFKTILMTIPSLKEQEKIAQILSNIDMNIQKTEEAIAKYKQVKKGLMDDLLSGKVRIKDGKRFRETRFKDVKGIGKIPWDWKVKKVEEVSDVVDSLHETPIYSDNGYKMIRVNDIKEGKLDTTNAYKVSKEVYNHFTKKYKPQKGDIILSRVGSYGMSCYIESDESICLGQNTVVINPHIIKLYLYYYLNSKEIRKQIDKAVVGSSQKTLSLANINNLDIGLPQEEEQYQIANVLFNQDEIIEKENKYLEKLKKLKLGLMEDLLTGKVRV